MAHASAAESSSASVGGHREFLVVAHTGREIVSTTIAAIGHHCAAAGITLRVIDHDTGLGDHPVDAAEAAVLPASAEGSEIAIVLGGDGTFLRAAELTQPAGVPVLGINLGHIGFLAEAEVHRLDAVMAQLIAGDYRVEPRMALDVAVIDPAHPETPPTVSWALNEVAVLNKSSTGVLELITEVDGRPVSGFGADGVLVSTPTGSTAYAFSAGGPVMWPDLEAILVVPSNAHALFARPMVTSPRSRIAVEVDKAGRSAVALCDGRRRLEVPAGARVEVVRSERSVQWVRIDSDPFADRLVRKFDLPVTGWRGRQT
ncbi:MAG: NAD kinase [Gordonia sp. (in: high G+C Gram-positive bacteria)]